MTPQQRQEFESQGLTCLHGAVDTEVVSGIVDRVWERAAARMGVHRDDSNTWQRVKPSTMKPLKESEGLFDPILGEVVTSALDELLGPGGWVRPETPGHLIMTPPGPGEWTLPHQVWHMDAPAPGWVDGPPGVQVFLLLDRLGPHDGGTLVVAGSHRLVRSLPERANPDYEGHSAQIRRALRVHVPWLRELWEAGAHEGRSERFMDRVSEHEGVPIRVLELTGEPGDVYLMHVWMLHAGSMNASDQMRMMLTERLFRADQRLWSHSR